MIQSDPILDVRTALVDTAARLLAEGGPKALTARRLAGELGISTTMIYTHFENMAQLRRELRRDGFARLGERLDLMEQTDDPVADLSVLGWAYGANGLASPNLYRAMFLEVPLDAEDAAIGLSAFARIRGTVERCIQAGRFRRDEPSAIAMQLWIADHGTVSAVLSGLLTIEEATRHGAALARSLFVGFGDDTAAAAHSIELARRRMTT